VEAYLQDKLGGTDLMGTHRTGVQGASFAGALSKLTAGALVGHSRQLFSALTLQETQNKTRVISAPRIIATDSIPASINVGLEVPTLTAQAVTGVQSGGSSLFANTISNRSTGVTLSITAHVNPSGVVTLVINQDISAPQEASSGGIQSPSFSNRKVSTQVTVQDGDMIAIGGIITDQGSEASTGVPFLHRLPLVGAAFGSKSSSRSRAELVVFMTPRVIYDTNEIADASDEILSHFNRLRKIMKE
jgi:general secretion pathway protein D